MIRFAIKRKIQSGIQVIGPVDESCRHPKMLHYIDEAPAIHLFREQQSAFVPELLVQSVFAAGVITRAEKAWRQQP